MDKSAYIFKMDQNKIQLDIVSTQYSYLAEISTADVIQGITTEISLGNHSSSLYPALALYTGFLDSTYVEKINTFWLHFDPPSPRTHYTMGILYSIIAVVGACGNALVVYMFIRCKSLRTPANTLVINLAISDFAMCGKCPMAIYNSFNFGPALGDIGCRLYGFIGGLTGTVSITTLTAISIDRYHVVVYPLDPLRSTTKRRVRGMLAFIWIYSFTFAIIPALDIGLSHYVPEGFLTTCSFDYLSKSTKERIFMFVYFVAAWCIPFMTISYCYFYILKVVVAANSIQSSKDKNKTELKLTAVVIAVIGLWFLAWTPYSIVALLGITGNEDKLTPLASMIPAFFCKTAACIDPYVYAITHPRFRSEFKRVFFGQTIRRASTFRSTYSRSSTVRRHTVGYAANIRSKEDLGNNNVELSTIGNPIENPCDSLCESELNSTVRF